MQNLDLYICNSVYQILVAMWIKRDKNSKVPGDLIVSNHLNNGSVLAERVAAEGIFRKVFYVESMDYARYRTPYSTKERYREELMPRKVLSAYWDPADTYSRVYMANPDRFSQLVFNALSRKNRDLKAALFEDGMLSYSPMFRKDVDASRIELDRFLKRMAYRFVFRRRSICDHVSEMLLFHPKDLDWEPWFPVVELAKIDCEDEQFRMMCNRVFGYDSTVDQYDRKYLFMEESFAAEGVPINDVQLLKQLAQRVGKDNIMVKIHPRNPVNRFAAEGFKTNQNTSIPWELIVMNLGDISDMTLVTVASSSVLNPMMIFGKKVKAYSLYNLVDKGASKSRLLTGPFWNTVHKAFLENADMITICDSMDDIR